MARMALYNDTPHINVDVVDSGNAYILRAEVPGADKQHIHIEVEGNTVNITVKKDGKGEHKAGERVVRQECYWGELHRCVPLGSTLDREHTHAKLENGILTLTLPKKQGHSDHRITIS